MVNIGGKVYRNLQEQVGYNSEQIKKIFSILDGIDYEDHVVVIEDIATPLNEEEMEIVNQPVSFLVYLNKLYFKNSTDSEKIYFSAVMNLAGTSVVLINKPVISVDIQTGEISIENVSAEVYSSEQVDEIILDLHTLIADLASGSPKGVYATLSDLETAFPTGTDGIYIVSANGHWYYWDGGAWSDGGVYQASQITLNSIDYSKISEDIAENFESINLFDKTKVVSGGYYNSSGTINLQADSDYSTQYIRVKSGVTYKVSSIVYPILFCTYDKDGNFIERLNITTLTFTFGATVAFVRLSMYTHHFSATFMFCENSKYPTSYQDYNLEVMAKAKNISDLAPEVRKVIADTGEAMTSVTKTSYPIYANFVDNYYAGGSGEKSNDNNFASIEIKAITNFDIWINGAVTGYVSLCLYNTDSWDNSYFVARYRNTDNNLPTSLSKLTVKEGQCIVISYRKSDTTFTFSVDGLLKNLVFKNEYSLNNKQIEQIGLQKISVVKSGDNYEISMGKYKFPFNKALNVADNLDSYDINTVYLNGNTLEAGNIIGVVKEYGQADFMGGVQHGDEQIISMNIYCDGMPITDSVTGNRIDIHLISNLKRVSDHTTDVMKRLVHIVFENNKMIIETTFRCLVDNFSCENAYVGMWGQYTNKISALFNNVDTYDINNYHSVTFGNDELKWTSYISDEGSVNVGLDIGYKEPTSNARYVYYSDTYRLKNYFSLANGKVLNTDEILYGKAIYEFN